MYYEKISPQCTEDDHIILAKLNTSDTHAFYQDMVHCGKNTISFLNFHLDWHQDAFVNCMRKKKTQLTPSCVGCYGMDAKYGLQNCKLACMLSWCSLECIKCTEGNFEQLTTCIGKTEQLPLKHTCRSLDGL